MNNVLPSILISFPLIISVIVTAIIWKIIDKRMLFFAVACLSLFGIQSLVAPASVAYVVIQDDFARSSQRLVNFSYDLQISALLIIVLGLPMLWRLFHVFRRT